MAIELTTPRVTDLPAAAEQLAGWQSDDWPGHLHPGDLGWHSMVGAEQMWADLRTWTDNGSAVAISMLDGPVLRMALDPRVTGDAVLAARIAEVLTDPSVGAMGADAAVLEVRGAHALGRAGSSSAVVAAENANEAALATYRAAGFIAWPAVADLVRPTV